MKKENELIHVKLEYEEALDSRKDLLSSQVSLLKVAKALTLYHKIRSEELRLKTEIHKLTKSTRNEIKKLLVTLPELKIPKNLRKENGVETKVPKLLDIPEKKETDLEIQLREIQDKLRAIGG